MARTQARAGFGLQLWRGDGATPTEIFTKISEVTDINPVGAKTLDTVEATHMESDDGYKEYVATLKDQSEITVEVNWLVGDASQGNMVADYEAKTLRNWRIVLNTTGKRLEGAAFVSAVSQVSPRDGKMTRTFTLRPSGKWNEVTNS